MISAQFQRAGRTTRTRAGECRLASRNREPAFKTEKEMANSPRSKSSRSWVRTTSENTSRQLLSTWVRNRKLENWNYAAKLFVDLAAAALRSSSCKQLHTLERCASYSVPCKSRDFYRTASRAVTLLLVPEPHAKFHKWAFSYIMAGKKSWTSVRGVGFKYAAHCGNRKKKKNRLSFMLSLFKTGSQPSCSHHVSYVGKPTCKILSGSSLAASECDLPTP